MEEGSKKKENERAREMHKSLNQGVILRSTEETYEDPETTEPEVVKEVRSLSTGYTMQLGTMGTKKEKKERKQKLCLFVLSPRGVKKYKSSRQKMSFVAGGKEKKKKNPM